MEDALLHGEAHHYNINRHCGDTSRRAARTRISGSTHQELYFLMSKYRAPGLRNSIGQTTDRRPVRRHGGRYETAQTMAKTAERHFHAGSL